ncbi:hypothetical protein C5N14_30320 [Micromonospora sp. MW-13]|nr:hypothetical protein C5N14_30320 [Micromonospora sp. MW-13]
MRIWRLGMGQPMGTYAPAQPALASYQVQATEASAGP